MDNKSIFVPISTVNICSLLKTIIDYYRTHKDEPTFSDYMKNSWKPSFIKNFSIIERKINRIVIPEYVKDPIQDTLIILSSSDFYQIYRVIAGFLEDPENSNFSLVIRTTLDIRVFTNYTNIYHEIEQKLFNYYAQVLNENDFTELEPFDYYHILKVIVDYLKSQDYTNFIPQLKASEQSWKTYNHINTVIANYYNMQPKTRDEQILEFIMSME